MRATLLSGLACCVTAMLGGSCTTMFSDREKLVMAVREYNDGVRWSRLDQAVGRMVPDSRQRFLDRHAALAEELDITDYDVTRIDVERETATVTVEVSWSLKRRGLLERTIVVEDWKRQRGDWVLVKESRLRGAPLTLFDERAPPVATAPNVLAGAASQGVPSQDR